VIIHWTAGAHKASSLDRAHYHILIEDDGNLVRGTHSIRDNALIRNGVYAAHTKDLNTGSIGVSVCCMGGAKESPFRAGNCPMTQKQWDVMAQVVAELCDFYRIDVTERGVLGHGEVERVYRIPQDGKWDPMVLPWNASLSKTQVGKEFRELVRAKRAGDVKHDEPPVPVKAVIKGHEFREAQIFNERGVVKVRPLLDTFEGRILHATANGNMEVSLNIVDEPIHPRFLLIDHGNNELTLPADMAEGDVVSEVEKFGFVRAADLAKDLKLAVIWDGEKRTISMA
jgi:hypothetical protein